MDAMGEPIYSSMCASFIVLLFCRATISGADDWRAFLLLRCRINVGVGNHEERRLLTGVHIVADIYCNVCRSVLGWKYVRVLSHVLREIGSGDAVCVAWRSARFILTIAVGLFVSLTDQSVRWEGEVQGRQVSSGMFVARCRQFVFEGQRFQGAD